MLLDEGEVLSVSIFSGEGFNRLYEVSLASQLFLVVYTIPSRVDLPNKIEPLFGIRVGQSAKRLLLVVFFELLSVGDSLLTAASFISTDLVYLFDVNRLLLFRSESNCRGGVVTVIIFVIRIINVWAQLILTGLRWHYSVSLKRNGDSELSSDGFH